MSASPDDVAPDLAALLRSLDDERRRRRTSTATSAQRAAAVLREQVVEGVLRSGTRLPEERLATALGVSRNTLREALSQLVGERVLVREQFRGVVVATPDVADVADVYRARRVLEPGAVRAARLADPAGLAAVQAAVAEGRTAREAGSWTGVASANQHFHRALVALAGSARLDAEMDLLLAEMRLFFHHMSHLAGPQEFHEPYLDENGLIADHLARGDREAAAGRVDAYLLAAQEQLTAAFGRDAAR